MKKIIIIITILSLAFLFFQFMIAKNTNETLKYKYTIDKKIDEVELRTYKSAIFAKVTLKNGDFKDNSYKGFRILADYIFGNNKSQEKISMTSPVLMEMNKENTMEFIMPSNYDTLNLPKPTNSKIQIYEKPAWRVASLSFGGFANDEKIKSKYEELKSILEKNNISYLDELKYLGYNPPYQLINRINEVVLPIK